MALKPIQQIGILGGMGAAASADFYRCLVDLAQHHYHAEQDHDFPPMFLYNLSLMGFDETGFVDVEMVRQQLVAGVQKLQQAGSDFIVIPCNTVHYLFDDMQQAVSIPILSIVETTVDAVTQAGHTTIGLLSSQSTRAYKIYETALEQAGVEVLSATDAEQEAINKVILHVISGTQGEAEKTILLDIVKRFKAAGAQAVILGCTEIPLALVQEDTDVPLFNSTALLAQRALREAYGRA